MIDMIDVMEEESHIDGDVVLTTIDLYVYHLDEMPLIALPRWAENIVNLVPTEYLHNALLHCDTGDYTRLYITFTRPVTEEDRTLQMATEARDAAEQEAYERAQYERLKAKFDRSLP